MKFAKLVYVAALCVTPQAWAQSQPELFRGNWTRNDGSIYSTCTFGIEKSKITQQCGNGATSVLSGYRISGNTITLRKIFVGTSDEGHTVLVRSGNSLSGRYIRADGRPGPTGTFVKQ